MVNVGLLVNRRMELKKQGKLHEELVSKFIMDMYRQIEFTYSKYIGSFERYSRSTNS